MTLSWGKFRKRLTKSCWITVAKCAGSNIATAGCCNMTPNHTVRFGVASGPAFYHCYPSTGCSRHGNTTAASVTLWGTRRNPAPTQHPAAITPGQHLTYGLAAGSMGAPAQCLETPAYDFTHAHPDIHPPHVA